MVKIFNRQLALPLEFIKLNTKDNFLVNKSNQLAVSFIDELKDIDQFKKKYSYPILYVHGPEGSGKTHLGFIFKEIMNAKFIKHLKKNHLLSVNKGNSYILDDFEPKAKIDEEMLMHFFNESYSGSGSILILSKTPPGKIKYALPDLNSRVKSFLSAKISLPDDQVLYSILVKELDQRKLNLSDNLCFYILKRITRNYKSVLKLVKKLDRFSLESKTKLKLSDIRRVIENIKKNDCT